MSKNLNIGLLTFLLKFYIFYSNQTKKKGCQYFSHDPGYRKKCHHICVPMCCFSHSQKYYRKKNTFSLFFSPPNLRFHTFPHLSELTFTKEHLRPSTHTHTHTQRRYHFQGKKIEEKKERLAFFGGLKWSKRGWGKYIRWVGPLYIWRWPKILRVLRVKQYRDQVPFCNYSKTKTRYVKITNLY